MASRAGKRAIVLGGANNLHYDRDEALKLFRPDFVLACNHAGRDHDGIDAWVTMHPDIRDRLWIPARAKLGFSPVKSMWHPRHRGKWPGSTEIESRGGSSGMLCVTVALHLGFEKIVLCGIPMNKLNGHYDDPRPWHEARQYHNVWSRLAPELQGKVKSMSGWTRELLGAPTEEWLND